MLCLVVLFLLAAPMAKPVRLLTRLLATQQLEVPLAARPSAVVLPRRSPLAMTNASLIRGSFGGTASGKRKFWTAMVTKWTPYQLYSAWGQCLFRAQS